MDVDEDAERVSAYAWGNGTAFGEAQHAGAPLPLSMRGKSMRSLAAARDLSLLVTQSGALWAGGPNYKQWLFEEGGEETRRPERMDLVELEGQRVETVAAGRDHVLAILEDGNRLLSWGQNNEFGQLGHGCTSLGVVRPRAVALPLRVQVRQVSCGELHSLVLSVSGVLFAFGDGSHGALGLGNTESVDGPMLVEGGEMRGMPLRAIAAGAQHSMALSLSGSVLTWGNAKHGRLGLGSIISETVLTPKMIPEPRELTRYICAGGRHSAVILRRGLCLLAGDNQHGQLGVSPQEVTSSPSFMPLQGKWRMAALGEMHTLLLAYDGSVHSCGNNDVGQLGSEGAAAGVLKPVSFPSSEAVVGIAAGADHAIALTTHMPALQAPSRTQSLKAGQLSKMLRGASDWLPRSSTVDYVQRGGPPLTALGSTTTSLAMVAEDEQSLAGLTEVTLGPADDDDYVLQRADAAYHGSRPKTAPSAMASGHTQNSDDAAKEAEEIFPQTLTGGCTHPLSKEIKIKLTTISEGSSALETLLRPVAWPGVCASAQFAGLDVPMLSHMVEALRTRHSVPSPDLKEELRRNMCAVLANPALLNASFCFPGLRRPRVDAVGLVKVFSELWDMGVVTGRLEVQLREAAAAGLHRWAGSTGGWDDSPPPLWHRDQVRGLATLLLCPLVSQADSSPQAYALMEVVVSLFAALPGDGRTALVSIIIDDMVPVLRSVLVANIRRFCDAAIRKGAQLRRMGNAVWNGLLVLDLLAFANQSFQENLRSELVSGLLPTEGHADFSWTISGLAPMLSRTRSASATGMTTPVARDPPASFKSVHTAVAAPVPPSDFQLQALAEDVVPADVEFALFMQNAQTRIPSRADVLKLRPHDERLHSFMVHRHLLPASFVRRVLQRENLYRQHMRQQESLQDLLHAAMTGQATIGPGGQVSVDPSQMFFILSVRREHILEDTMQVLQQAAPADLQRQIKICFQGEEGQDAGGVSREFFRLLGEQLFSLQSQLFDPQVAEEARVLWFDAASPRDSCDFWLVGVIVGLAVYNNLPGLDVRFPTATFKKLTGEPLNFEDFEEVHPALSSSFRALLAWEPPAGLPALEAASLFENTFCLDFEVSYETHGETQTVELKEGGRDLAVTLENRAEFVRLYCTWAMDTSIARQFEPFKKGFSRICDSPLFHALSGAELAQIVLGESDLHLEALRQGARYEGFQEDSEYIKGFWDILSSYELEQRRRFLAFTTGSNRAPVGGLREIRLLIQRNGNDDQRLPLAHTCFNTLLLPEYSSLERLSEALLTAIENSEGFGLE